MNELKSKFFALYEVLSNSISLIKLNNRICDWDDKYHSNLYKCNTSLGLISFSLLNYGILEGYKLFDHPGLNSLNIKSFCTDIAQFTKTTEAKAILKQIKLLQKSIQFDIQEVKNLRDHRLAHLDKVVISKLNKIDTEKINKFLTILEKIYLLFKELGEELKFGTTIHELDEYGKETIKNILPSFDEKILNNGIDCLIGSHLQMENLKHDKLLSNTQLAVLYKNYHCK